MATTAAGDRYLTLDTVRGVAVLGILLLNIIAFSMPAPAYMNPAAYGGAQGADLAVWLGNFILFDSKMRGLFSFLFGASTLLVIDRATAKGESPGRVHYARMIWLLVFGLLHLWLVWWGDILSNYALMGMIAFFFRGARIKTLLIVGCILLGVQFLVASSLVLVSGMAQAMPDSPEWREAALALERGFGQPPQQWLAEDVALHRDGWWSLTTEQFRETSFAPIAGVFQYGWETLAYMLFGMAAFRNGMLAGRWERRRYWRWVAIGFGIGIAAYGTLALWIIGSGFEMTRVIAGTMVLTVPLRPLMIMGWASLIILLLRPGGLLTSRLAAAGRMAFTNYLATSLICTFIFYGWGLGWYGELSRAEVYLVVFGVWALILLWSKPWLERFAYGPLEWLWRSLARGRPQTMAGGVLVKA
ncbi:DUF418 domain-containing protein [Sphingomonas sp. ST-64]|uniref:DUF418 domain-containing protein n=1 Tax=Sphingomonas plantiphila TaxID=3163295 RepID=A0ABW8YNY1_9SPHN